MWYIYIGQGIDNRNTVLLSMVRVDCGIILAMYFVCFCTIIIITIQKQLRILSHFQASHLAKSQELPGAPPPGPPPGLCPGPAGGFQRPPDPQLFRQ